MNTDIKRTVFVTGTLAMLFHFTVIIKGQFDQSGFRYTYPYFDQSWKMFVPAPEVNYEVIAVLESGESINLSQQTLKSERVTPGFGRESRVLCLFNCLHYFDANITLTGLPDGKVSSDNKDMKLIRRVTEALLKEQGITERIARMIICVRPMKDDQRPRLYHS